MFGFLRKQFIDVIEWPNPGEDTLMWRFPAQDQEIQSGATLVVRESQQALFVDEGKTADMFGAGTHLLTTQTLPLLTNLKNWDKFFASPFKSDVYFFNLRQQLGRRWGTAQPVTVRDSEFGAVQLRAFGMYDYRISDPAKLFSEVTLKGQSFVKNPDITVEQLLKEKGADVVQFTRFELGEGIEKEESDFVAEVMAQAKGV